MSAAPGTVRSALAHADFRRLLTALAVSSAGDWLYNVALLAFVFERTHSAGWLAATTAARVLPIVVLGPLGGALADRWDRRRVMVVSDLARTLIMLALAGVAAAGLPVVLAPVLAGLATAASAPYPSCAAATTSRLVPDADLPGANAARSAVGMAAVAGGPAVGAVLLLLGSPAVAFGVNALSFAVSGLAVLAISQREAFRPGRAADDTGSLVADVVLGARALRAHPVALRLVGADTACSVVYGMETVLLVVVARHLGLGAAGYGWLLAAVGAGGVAATLGAGRLITTARPRSVLVGSLLVLAAAGALTGLTPVLPLVLLWSVLAGAAAIIVEVLAETALQRQLEEDVFARAYGIAFPLSIGGIVVGSLVAAPLLSVLGLPGALLAMAAVAGGYALVVACSGAPVAVPAEVRSATAAGADGVAPA